MDSFTHLHNHTEYSMLDGAQKLKPMFEEVARQGMPAVAMSDHGNMFGAYDFYSTSRKFPDVKPIIGIEAYVAPSSRLNRKREFWNPAGARQVSDDMEATKDVSGGGRYTHMTMWARNARGLRNLFRLSTEASYTGQYPAGKPRMDMELIAEHSEGIIGTTGCPSGAIQTRLRLGQYDEARKTAAAYQEILGKENYFLELMDHGLSIESQVRGDLLRLAKELGIPLLATNDAHYIHANQADAHDNLLCIGTGKNKSDENRFKFSGTGYYLKTAQEMRSLFSELPEACDNTLLIAERVESYDEVFAMVDEMPDYPDVPDGATQEEWLRQECLKGLEKRYGVPLPAEVMQRFETEMSVIGPMGFSSYFLIVADICRYARDNGIPVGPGRGSATGSIVAYATRITELCPLEQGLLFERFLNPERINPPDVDLDFDDRQREKMVRYVSEKYGAEYTSMVITFGKIKAKNAIKDAARILEFPYQQGERITKALPPDVNGNPVPLDGILDPEHPRYGECGDVREMYESEPDVKKIIDTAKGVEGLTRNTGVHAAAVIISKTPLVERIPLHMRTKDEARIAGFDYPSCESLGLLKMDFLGLRNLGIIDHALKIIKKNRNVHLVTVDPMDGDPDKRAIPLDDKKTFSLLAKGDTLGVFQLDGGGMRALLKLMEPTRFEDIAAALALYRPGPMAANAHTNYALRQNGKQKPEPIHPELKEVLDPILGSTHHLLVYQEQIMAVARELAGYTLGGADMLRRAMGKKKPEVLASEWDKFRTGMEGKRYSPEAVQALWDVMLPFSGYAFNKCVSGKTVVTRAGRGGNPWTQSVENLANRIHGREDYDGNGCRFCRTGTPVGKQEACSPCRSWRKKWSMQKGMNAIGRVGDRLQQVRITDVFRQGVKPLWKMTLDNGMSIESTSNHRHLTSGGWRELSQISVGDEVCVMAEGDWGSSLRSEFVGGKAWTKIHGYTVAERAHGKAGPFLHGRNAEFKRNTATLERKCARCGEAEGRLERAHLNGDPTDNSKENLAILCNSCHKRQDYANGGRRKRWAKGRSIDTSRVVSIEYIGKKMTYDVTVDSEDHSWVANDGIVTHNSHTAGYGLISYWTAYLKANYPAEYMAALLTSVQDDKDKAGTYLADARRLGIKVLPPDVNESVGDFTAVGDAVRFGLRSVRNVGDGLIEAVIKARETKGAFTSFADYVDKVDLPGLNKRGLESLIKGGAFDSLGHSRKGLSTVYEMAVDAAIPGKKAASYGQDDLFSELATGVEGGVSFGLPVEISSEEWPRKILLSLEREMLGLYVSAHPLDGTEHILSKRRDSTVIDLLTSDRTEGVVRLAGLITNVQHKVTRKGKSYAIVSLADRDGEIDVLFFASAYTLASSVLIEDSVVSVQGQINERDGAISIFGQEVQVLDVSSAEVDGGPLVRITFPATKVTPESVSALKQILHNHPGEADILLRVTGPCKTTVYRLDAQVDKDRVEPEIARAFGVRCLEAVD
jgi:DNA-directed DNA polymerase III PolC